MNWLFFCFKIRNMHKYHIITYGCQANKSNSERIATILDKKGYKAARNAKQADLVIINMCSVRQNAVDRAYGRIRSLNDKKVILTGCILKEDREEFKKEAEIVDFKDLFRIKPKIKYPDGFVPIMEGCDNFCAYCVVPFTRGREYYRKEKEIIKEVKSLIKKGLKHITLLGQSIASYPNFPKLLKKIDKIPGNFQVFFLTSHPRDFSDELIKVIKESKKIKKYIHLPVQSGDNEVLRKMKRNYTREQYLKLIKKIKKEIPDIEISTDVIVGFPGETKKHFQNTLDLFKKADFSNAYIACYSPRPNTAAFRLKDNIPSEKKERRATILRNLFKKMKKSKLIVILGPTASGKSEMALRLAKKFKGEIISADSRQIYKEMNIGTAKLKNNQKIVHYLIDIKKPNQEFNVALFKKSAIKIIKDIQRRGKTPFLVGGTGLYIKSIVDNLNFPTATPQLKLREKLEKKSLKELFKIYNKLDSKGAKFIDKENKRRLIRAIEVCKITGKPFWEQRKKEEPVFEVLQIGIKLPKKILKKNIEKRVEKMFKDGLEKEVRGLVKKYGWIPPLQTIGYQEWKEFFEDKINEEEVKKLIIQHTNKFAKRQMTWFKRDIRIHWIKNQKETEKLVRNFLK